MVPEIKYCPGTLAEGFNTYSPGFLRRLFNGKKVSHILQYDTPEGDNEVAELFIENRKHISISGVQEKLSLVLEKNILRLTNEKERGTYILKPIPRDVKNIEQVPANEHLTMQIANQVYGINTAENAIIFFADGDPAYITRRFDVKPDGSKRGKEDFATLAGKARENDGPDFKYNYSYEEASLVIKKYVPAWRVEIEKYFSLVLFNYLLSNGDAHLKNFSILETDSGDYILSPAYDLLNTRLHVNDSDFALQKGLFADNSKSKSYIKNNHPGKEDFIEFGKRIGISEERMDDLMKPFLLTQPMIEELTSRSFLDNKFKKTYYQEYLTKKNYLKG
jgi:serine/threonine-protein kinase HipA